jgi:hypothetical protein
VIGSGQLVLGQGYEEEEATEVTNPQVVALYTAMNKKTTSFYEIARQARQYISQHPEDQNFAHRFTRWENFWSNRVGATGNFNAYAQYLSVLTNPNTICNSGNSNWQQLGPVITASQNSGYVRCVYAPPGQSPVNTIFAGSNTAGLWKTTDNGVHWQNLTDQLRLPGLGVIAIIAKPNGTEPPTTMYIGTGNSVGFFENYGVGVFKSTDGGNTWAATSLDYTAVEQQPIEKLMFDETDATYNTIYALGQSKLWKTTDGGINWQNVTSTLTLQWDETFSGVEIIPGLANTLVLSTKKHGWPYSGANIYKSIDAGATWQVISPNASNMQNPAGYYFKTEAFHVDASTFAPGKIFAMYNDYEEITNAQGAIIGNTLHNKPYMSLDLATPDAKWQVLNATVNTDVGFFGAGFEISDADFSVIYSGKLCLQKSIDLGSSFLPALSSSATTCPDSDDQHADLRGFQIYTPNTGGVNDVILIGTDGGVSKSTDGGISWANLNGSTLILTQFYDITNSSARPGIIAGGAQDNHTYLRQTNGQWSLYAYGDGGHTIMDANTPTTIYGRGNANLFKSVNDNISSLTTVYTNNIGSVFDDFLMTAKPEQSSTLYFAKDEFFQIIDGTGTLPNPTFSKNLALGDYFVNVYGTTYPIIYFNARALSAAPSNGNIVYLAGDIKYDNDPNPNVEDWKDGTALFKSENGGTGAWSVVSYIHGRVNAIAIDPRNPNHICIAKGGFPTDDTGQTQGRVEESINGGLTFTDMSLNNGLTPFPVNALAYVNGSNGILYAGTDVGVYRYNPATNAWGCFNHNLPVCIVTDLEIDYCKRLLHIGTFGRGIWQSNLDNADFAQDYLITENTIYQQGRVINAANTIRVQAHKSLTINGTLNMAANAFIIVEPSAELIINGKITNACGDMWGGIRVLGNKTLGQTGSYPDCLQGKVTINAGAKIEHARDAISTWNGSDANTAGGIIIANGATFTNNHRDLEFMQYDNYYSGFSHPNLSNFYNCTFTIDNNYRNTDPIHRVTMWDVDGVQFKKCNFINNNTNLPDAQQNFYGIYSIDAGYKVGSNSAADACTFQKLSCGIKATRAAGNHTISVQRSNFTGNTVGIITQNVNTAKIVNNTFTLHNPARGNLGFGLIVYTGTGYNIQKNTFIGNNVANKTEIGIWVNNTGPDNNRIYNNTFTKLDYANLALGDNRNDPLNPDAMGLHYECNTHTQGLYDMYIAGGNGIRLFQNGILGGTQSAQNKYSRNGTSESDYYLHSGLPVTQYYDNALLQTQALDFTTEWFTQVQGDISNPNTCPDQSQQISGLAQPARQVLANSFTQAETDYGNTLYLYNALIDNGNTNALLDNIDLVWSNDAWTLRNQLVAKSPNLSQEVLRRAALTGTLPDAMLIEILLLNADACKDKAFLDFLAHDIPNPLPQNLLDLLLCTQESGSLKKTLYRNLLNYRSLMLHNGQLMVSNILNDSIPNLTDLHQWLQRQHTSAADYVLAESYLTHNNGTAGSTLLSDMPNRYLYVLRNPNPHTAYMQLYTLKRQVIESNRNWLQLTNTEKSQLQTLANGTPTDAATIQAQNILCFVNGSNCGLPTLPNLTPAAGSGKQISTNPQADINKLLTTVTVYPNPARDYVTFAYSVPSKTEAILLVITDPTGKEITQLSFTNLSGELLWDTRTIPTGLYYYTVLSGTDRLASGTVSIVK